MKRARILSLPPSLCPLPNTHKTLTTHTQKKTKKKTTKKKKKVVKVLGFRLPFYAAPTLLLSLGVSLRVLYHLVRQRPSVMHVSTPGVMCFAAVLYARLLSVPLVFSYHTHIPEYIPRYT